MNVDVLRVVDGVRQDIVVIGAELYSARLLLERGEDPSERLDRIEQALKRIEARHSAALDNDYGLHWPARPGSYDNCDVCGLPQNRWALESCS